MLIEDVEDIARAVQRRHEPDEWCCRLARHTLLVCELARAEQAMREADGGPPRAQVRAAVRLGKALIALRDERLDPRYTLRPDGHARHRLRGR